MIDPLPAPALVLETARLRLRPYSEADFDIACAVLCDPEVTRFVCDPMTPGMVARKLPQVIRRGAGGRIGMWCAELRATGEKIGDGVLTPIPVEESDTDWAGLRPDAYPQARIEVGYMLKRSAWGQGFASEICARLLRFAFEQTALDEVVACTDPENHASQAVLRKCGMQDRGMARAYGEDVPWFTITRAEWRAQASHQLPSGSPG